MAKKKEEKKEENKEKVVEKKAQDEKIPVLKLVADSKLDAGLVSGALNKQGLYLQFIEGLEDINKELRLTKKEFDKIINDFKNGEL